MNLNQMRIKPHLLFFIGLIKMTNINNYKKGDIFTVKKVNKGDIFTVNKTIWLKWFPNKFRCGGWTDVKPVHNNGMIKKGAVLKYDRDYKDAMVLTFFNKCEPSAEFYLYEIENLCKLGILTRTCREEWARLQRLHING